jgi:hypothetical protein
MSDITVCTLRCAARGLVTGWVMPEHTQPEVVIIVYINSRKRRRIMEVPRARFNLAMLSDRVIDRRITEYEWQANWHEV